MNNKLCLGLYDALCRNPELCSSVLDSLLDHFNQFYQSDQATLPPLDIAKAITIQGADIVVEVGNYLLISYVRVRKNFYQNKFTPDV